MMVLMLIVLLILIIQDIKSHTISLYSLVALTACAVLLDLFWLESAFVGLAVLTTICIYAHFGLEKPILECIGNGDILLLALICAMTPFEYVSGVVFLSGILGSFWYLFSKNQHIPLGAGIASAYAAVALFV